MQAGRAEPGARPGARLGPRALAGKVPPALLAPLSLVVFAALTALARASVWDRPAGFDAGQYLYIGGLVLDGDTPYVDAVNNKGPLLYLLFAVFRLSAGTSPLVVWMTLGLFTALAALALAGYVARYAGPAAGLLVGVVFVLVSNAPELSGLFIHSEHYGVAPMMAALWLATRPGWRSAVGAGAMVAAAALMNPAFALVAPFAAAELWRWSDPGARAVRLGTATLGVTVLALPILGWISIAGAFDEMLSQVGGQIGDTVVIGRGAGAGGGPALAGLGLGIPEQALAVAALLGAALAARLSALRWLAIGSILWMAAAWARVEVASYSYEQHYYLVIPGIAVGIGLGLASLWRGRIDIRLLAAVAAVVAVLWSTAIEPGISPVVLGETREEKMLEERADWSRPASLLRARTPADATLLAWDPQVYWLADRVAPTRYFDLEETRGASPAAAERTDQLLADPPNAVAASTSVLDEGLARLVQSPSLEYEPIYIEGERLVLVREG